MYSVQQVLHPFALCCEYAKGCICPTPAIKGHRERISYKNVKQLDYTEPKKIMKATETKRK